MTCLALRAEVSPSPAYLDSLDGRGADETGLSLAAFDLKALLIGACAPIQMHEGHLRRTTQFQPLLQLRHDTVMQSRRFLLAQFRSVALGMQPRTEEYLVGVDIAQASDNGLIHQGCLDRSSLPG